MNRTAALLPCLVLFCLLSCADYVSAENYVHKTISGDMAKKTLNTLQNMAWIADGKDTGRYVYVLYSPSCTYCDLLFDKTRAFTDKYQFRWILVELDGAARNLYEKPEVDSIRAIFKKDELPEEKNPERNARINEATANGFFFLMMQQSLTDNPTRFGFPALVYGDGNKLSTIIGMPQDIAKALEQVPTVPAGKGTIPAAFALAERDVQFQPIPDQEYENRHTTPVPVRMMPFRDAPQVATLKPGKLPGLTVTGVSPDGFVYIFIDTFEPRLYIEDQDFVDRVIKNGK